jgi:Suppressor of fused protein (SUFU)
VSAELIEHLEKFLGKIEEGWSTDADGRTLPFQVVRLSRAPIADCDAFSTLGLSQHQMQSQKSGRRIAQEFVMLIRRCRTGFGIPGLLQQVASEALKEKRALLRGEVVGPRGLLWKGGTMEALYVSLPVYLPDEFAECAISSELRVVFSWLVPIGPSEARYVSARGWEAFERALVKYDPDLVDPYRKEIAFA